MKLEIEKLRTATVNRFRQLDKSIHALRQRNIEDEITKSALRELESTQKQVAEHHQFIGDNKTHLEELTTNYVTVLNRLDEQEKLIDDLNGLIVNLRNVAGTSTCCSKE